MVAAEYTERLKASGILGEKISLMEIPKYMKENHHIYYINCPNEKFREALRLSLLEDGIDARTHFVPLHASNLGKEMWYEDTDLPNSMETAQRILRLPIHTQLSREDVEFVSSRLIRRVREL
jgi:dTDP-4-amino-4,6-dideoxygalactose transaminase